MLPVHEALLYTLKTASAESRLPILTIGEASFKRDAEHWNPQQNLNPQQSNYGTILLSIPKQKDEIRYLIARAFQLIAPQGLLMVGGANDAGGKTLGKMLHDFNVAYHENIKHKCRVVWTTQPEQADPLRIDKYFVTGEIQKREDGLWSQAGLFSWDHIDKGSKALLSHLPLSLSGIGADLGCGIGILGQKILQRYKDVELLYCVDNDIRALACAQKNLDIFNTRAKFMHADLNQTIDLPLLDFVVMNPPFHQGKKQTIGLGQEFIRTAHRHLKTGGHLIFVANSHLPYEAIIRDGFSLNRILNDHQGFKIIEAVK